jgi:hypothetical protein
VLPGTRGEIYDEEERRKDSGLILENDDDALRDKDVEGELEYLNDIDEEIQGEICAASSESAAHSTPLGTQYLEEEKYGCTKATSIEKSKSLTDTN